MDVMRSGNAHYIENVLQASSSVLTSKPEHSATNENHYNPIYGNYSDGNYSPSSSPASIMSSSTPIPSPVYGENSSILRTFCDISNSNPVKTTGNVNISSAFLFPDPSYRTVQFNTTRPSSRQYSGIAPKTIADLCNSFTFANQPKPQEVATGVQSNESNPNYPGDFRSFQSQSPMKLNTSFSLDDDMDDDDDDDLYDEGSIASPGSCSKRKISERPPSPQVMKKAATCSKRARKKKNAQFECCIRSTSGCRSINRKR